jgi:hypothetical protein
MAEVTNLHGEDEPTNLGIHDGQPILSQKIIIQKTGDGLSKSMKVAPTHVETDGERNIVGRLRHRSRRFVNIYTKPDKDSDEPPKIKGVEQVDVFDAVGIVFDERTGTDSMIDGMLVKIADREAAEKAKKVGQFTLKGVQGAPPDGDKTA